MEGRGLGFCTIFFFCGAVTVPLGVSSYFSLLRSSVNGRKIKWNPGGVT